MRNRLKRTNSYASTVRTSYLRPEVSGRGHCCLRAHSQLSKTCIYVPGIGGSHLAAGILASRGHTQSAVSTAKQVKNASSNTDSNSCRSVASYDNKKKSIRDLL